MTQTESQHTDVIAGRGLPAVQDRRTSRRPLRAPQAMCEAYDYDSPVAFSRGMEIQLPGAKLIFVSGTASIGPDGETLYAGDLRAQARRMYENARAVLDSAGADWKDVVKATVFLKDIASDYAAFNEVRREYFRQVGLEAYPASTCVEARLCRDDLLVEMELLAVVTDESRTVTAPFGRKGNHHERKRNPRDIRRGRVGCGRAGRCDAGG